MTLRWLFLSFKGRLPRGAFWWASLAAWLAFAVLTVFIDETLGRPVSAVLLVPFLWATAALGTKRLRDRGKSPLAWLAALVPVVGVIWLVIQLAFRKGNPGDNQYGPDPLLRNADYLTVR